MTLKQDDTQFTLSLKEYLDDKFKVISQRIDGLASSIDALIRDTNHTKERVIALEAKTQELEVKYVETNNRLQAYARYAIAAFIVGTMIWVEGSRKALWGLLQKYLGL